MSATETSSITRQEAEEFLFREARYADEHQYDDWEALWTDDAIYWVPAQAEDIDPTQQMSVIFDNRSRIATRIKQLHTGKRHAQTPPSRLRRLISNVEIIEEGEDGTLVFSNFLVAESRERGTQLWAGKAEHRLRRVDGEVRMAYKKVVLVDLDRPLYTLAFLI
ncbi:MAG TPA: aromatic-ring-hydroxylating dioxygenase subunit beta [Baekduia sp.]|nr:aromatic-ring-hydroxylating dioxygenase subunit beta [Baekduia sp.]